MPIVEIGSRAIEVAYGSNLGQELAKHGILHLPCGGRGLCGKCLVKVWGEVSPPTAIERLRGVKPPLRLACQVRILGDTRVELISAPRKPVSVLSMDIPIREPRPMFRVVNEIPAVSKALLFDYSECMETVKGLVEVWDFGFAGAVEGDCDIYRAILIDVGTTTIHYAVVDEKGNTLWEDRKLNPQLVYGADVVTRISKALENRDVYRDLVEVLRKEVIELVDSTPCIAMGLAAGNSVMMSFLLGLPLETLAQKPFQPRVKALGVLHSYRCRPILVLSPIASFVGGDALADIAFAEYLKTPTPYLLLDIGTNTEIVLVKNRNPLEIYVASTPAGPAFEVHVSSGMPMAFGGATCIRIRGVLDDGTPVFDYSGSGLTGSALVSLVAELVRHGFVDAGGRFVKGYKRVGDVKCFRIGFDEEGREIVFSQLDMREIQKAIAAIRAGWRTVLAESGVGVDDLATVIVSGAFGTGLDIDDAMYIGILPRVDRDRVVLAGNTVIAGLKTLALDRNHAERILREVSRARYIELASNPEFSRLWIESLYLKPVDR